MELGNALEALKLTEVIRVDRIDIMNTPYDSKKKKLFHFFVQLKKNKSCDSIKKAQKETKIQFTYDDTVLFGAEREVEANIACKIIHHFATECN